MPTKEYYVIEREVIPEMWINLYPEFTDYDKAVEELYQIRSSSNRKFRLIKYKTTSQVIIGSN